jgi:hypothetical protein
MLPGSAMVSSRAAMLTPSPKMSPPSIIMSPALMPSRNTRRSGSGTVAFRSAIPRWISTAQRTAPRTLSKVARKPSPVVFTIRPRCSRIFGSISSRKCATNEA